jgi:hypothetical protein
VLLRQRHPLDPRLISRSSGDPITLAHAVRVDRYAAGLRLSFERCWADVAPGHQGVSATRPVLAGQVRQILRRSGPCWICAASYRPSCSSLRRCSPTPARTIAEDKDTRQRYVSSKRTCAMDESEKRPTRDAGRSAAAPLIRSVSTGPELTPDPDELGSSANACPDSRFAQAKRERARRRPGRPVFVRSRRAADRQSGARTRGEAGASRPAFRAFGVRVRRRPGCSSRRRRRSHPNSPPDAQRRQRPASIQSFSTPPARTETYPQQGFARLGTCFQHGMPSGAGLTVGGWRQSGIRHLERRRPRSS